MIDLLTLLIASLFTFGLGFVSGLVVAERKKNKEVKTKMAWLDGDDVTDDELIAAMDMMKVVGPHPKEKLRTAAQLVRQVLDSPDGHARIVHLITPAAPNVDVHLGTDELRPLPESKPWEGSIVEPTEPQ
jgi:hypothetical protein